MKIAVLGAGIVGGFTTRAILDTIPDANVVVISAHGKVQMPPPGAFYLHEVPGRIETRSMLSRHVEVRWGDNPDWYRTLIYEGSMPRIGARQTSADSLPRQRALGVFYPYPRLMNQLFEGATHLQGMIGMREVEKLSEEFDLVFQTIPLAHQGQPELQKQMIPVLRINQGILNITENLEKVFSMLNSDLSVVREIQDQKFWGNGFTLYNCRDGDWLRFTYHPEYKFADIELPMYAVGRAEAYCEVHKGNLFYVPKIPDGAPEQVSQFDNVILIGRYARQQRKLLAHEAYAATEKALRRFM